MLTGKSARILFVENLLLSNNCAIQQISYLNFTLVHISSRGKICTSVPKRVWPIIRHMTNAKILVVREKNASVKQAIFQSTKAKGGVVVPFKGLKNCKKKVRTTFLACCSYKWAWI